MRFCNRSRSTARSCCMTATAVGSHIAIAPTLRPKTTCRTSRRSCRPLDARRFDLFGHSWGALPAATYAVRHPDNVRRLVLYGPGMGMPGTAPPGSHAYERRAAMAALRRADLDLFARSMLMRAFPSGVDEENFRIFVWMQRIAASAEVQERLETVRFDGHLVLDEVQVPTLVLHRRDDQLAAFSIGEHCAQQIPKARFIPLEGDIHFPWLGDWHSVISPILEFLMEDASAGLASPRGPAFT